MVVLQNAAPAADGKRAPPPIWLPLNKRGPVVKRPPPACNVAIAIPVKNEAERIGACLRALGAQTGGHQAQIVLLLNNCADDTAATVKALRPSLPSLVHVVECVLPPEQASAGHARRIAMQHAARLLQPGGVLLTTDADSQAGPDWVAGNLLAIRQGADAVAGQAVIDPVEAALIPQHLHEDDARECAYADLLDEIDARLDPDPADPRPRHSEHSGASLAVTLEAYHRVGGVPALPSGEDRAFVAALRQIDARIRHPPGLRVTVSGRIVGRAVGGMADTIRRRIVHQDSTIDDRLEPARNRARRAALRALFRKARDGGACPPVLAAALEVDIDELAAALALPFAGAGWAALEGCSPALQPWPVLRDDLSREARRARTILGRLRSRLSVPAAAGPADTALPVVAAPA